MQRNFSTGSNKRVTGKAADARPQATVLSASNSGYDATKTTTPKLQIKLPALQTATQNLGAIGTTKQVTGKAADSGYTVAKKQASQEANRQTVSNYANTLAKEMKLNFRSGTSCAKTQYNPALESKLGQGKNWSEPQSPVGNLFETWAANDIASKMNAVGTVLRDDGKRQGLAVDSNDVTADSENLWYNRAGQYLQNEADRAQKIAETAYTRGTTGLNNTQRMFFDTGLAGLQVAGDLGVSAATAGIISPSVSMATRSFGNASMQARNAGGTHDQQLLFGGLGAAKEWGTNKLFDGLGGAYGKGITDDAVADIANKLFKSDIGRAGFRAVAGMGMESAENVLDSVISPALRTIYNDRTLGDVTGIRFGGLNNSAEDQSKLALQSKMGLGDNWEIHNPITKERVSELLYDAAIGGLLSGIVGGRDVAQTISGNPKGGFVSDTTNGVPMSGVGSVDSRTKGADYRAERPQNIEMPYVPLIELSMDDLALEYGGKLPAKGNYGRRDAIARARERLGLNENEAAYIPASNVTRNGDEYILKITKSTLNKMLSPADGGDVSVESLLIMDNLERIANNGVYYSSEGDRKGREHILGIDHLITSVYIDGTPMVVDMRVRVVQQERGGDSNNVLYYFTPEEINIIKESGSTSAAERQALRGEVSPLSIDRIAQKQGEIKGIYTPYRDAYHANRYQELERKYLDGSISPQEADELWELERIRG